MTFREWLELREPADAAARSRELVEHLPATDRHVIHDLGCGTGSMGRWLAPLLSGEQHWVLHDRDQELLEVADVPGHSVETRQSDITQLSAADLAGATLITASALLDMLGDEELTRLVGTCVDAGCPTLFTLSVVGRVELDPPDPRDQRMAAAFNGHQRRTTLGPDAATAAVERFRELGAEVFLRPSPWQLGSSHTELMAEWFRGWVGAACEQQPDLAAEAGDYSQRRLAHATVDHVDLLALPRSGR